MSKPQRYTPFIRRYERDIFSTLLLVVIALILKSVFYIWYSTNIGDSFFITQQSPAAQLFRTILLSPDPVPTQGYDDVWFHYLAYVDAFSNGWNPYSSPGMPAAAISEKYNYGPLYIILISWGHLYFGMSIYESILVSNFLFDSLNCGLFYLILIEFVDKKRAWIFSFIYMVSPVMLYYVNFKLLNLPQMTFFTLLFLLAFVHDRHQLATIALAFAFMTKLIPIFFLFPLFFYYKNKYSIQYTVQLFLIFIGYSVAIIFPFFLDDAQGTLTQFFSAGTRYPPEHFSFQSFFSDTIFPNLPLVFGSIFCWLMFRYGSRHLLNDKILLLRALIFYIIGVHGSFYPLWSRGFKYYHGYLFVFYIMLFAILHHHSKVSLALGILLCYLSNILIFNLLIHITSFHHRRVFWLYFPTLLLIWIFRDLRRLKRADPVHQQSDQNLSE